MENINYLNWIIIVFVFSIIYLVTDKPVKSILKLTVAEVTYENAKNALEKIGTWTTWLTGLQTASMAAMALLVKDRSLEVLQKNYGFFALLFFGSSIILSTWLLSSIPSIQQRLTNSTIPKKENDIYEKRIFSFIPISLGRFSGLVHTYFLIGIVFFVLFIFSLF